MLKWAELSLPKLLFGHNGRVIENQTQLDAALAKFAERLNEFVEVRHLDEGQPSRVDMAWNFDLSASSYITAHANLRVPGIQKLPAVFEGGQGVSWRSAGSRFMVSLYNKSKEMHRPGEVLRAEVSLRGRQFAQRLQGDWRDRPGSVFHSG